MMRDLRLAAGLAWRDLRGGLSSLWLVVAAVLIGVALMAAVGSLADSALGGLRATARAGLGGDVSLRLFHTPATPAQRAALAAAGTLAEVAELRTDAARPDGTARVLVELKAVDSAYPLYGSVRVAGTASLDEALAPRDGARGAAVDRRLLDSLGLALGDRLRIGGAELAIRAIIEHEPDRALRGFALGPRVIVARPALDEAGVAPGAPVFWYYRLRLNAGRESAAFLRDLEARFPDAGWRVVDAANGIPGVERTVQLARTLFLLVSVAVLLIGGVGAGAAVSAHVARRLPTLATLKALGATPRLVFLLFFLQTAAVAALAALLGSALGHALAAAAHPLLADWLPDADGAFRPKAAGLAALAGFLAILLFALPPLARAARLAPPRVWRGESTGTAGRAAGLAVAGIGAALAGLLAVWTGMPAIALAVAGAAAVLASGFRTLGGLLVRAARRLARREQAPRFRLALGNLGRPGAPTVPVSMALGLGLTLTVAVAVVGARAVAHVGEALPAAAPSLVLLNIAPEDAARLRAEAAGLPGVARVETAPFLHARISRLKGAPVTEADVPRSAAWAVRGDRGLSWSGPMPPDTRLTAGNWWPDGYAGPPLASVDAQVARRLGLAVGDSLTLALATGPVTATVANLRRVDWTGLDLDFPVLLSPPAEPPPHTLVAALWTAPDAVEPVAAALGAPALRVGAVLDTLRATVERVRAVLTGVSAAGLAAAAVVLAGTVAAGTRQRRREMLVLHALGVERGRIGRVLVLEFTLLGAAVAAVAVPLGALAGGLIAALVTDGPLRVDMPAPLLAAAATVAGMAAVGALLALGLRGARARELRTE